MKPEILFRLLPSLLLFISALTATAEPAKIEPDRDYAAIAKTFTRIFPAEHLSRQKLNDETSCMSWTNYIASLDYERIYFLESDIESFKAKELLLDDQLKAGDLSFAYDVFHVFKERIADRSRYVASILEEGLNIHSSEKYIWQRKNLAWPKDQEDWNRIWKQKITNEYIIQMLSRTNIFTNTVATVATNRLTESVAQETLTATNQPLNTSSNNTPLLPALTPEEAIVKRYESMMTVMNDNDAEWVLQKYLSAFCNAYDPHSGYMSPSSMEDFDIEMKLSLVGIGALLKAEDGAAQIEKTIAGGPADKDKRPIRLVPGDKIIAVGQDNEEPVNILHLPLYKIVKLIRGPKNSRVVLIVIPASDPTGSTTKTVDLIRDDVKLEDAAAQWKTMDIKDSADKQKKLGVITLPAFYSNMNINDASDPDFRSSTYDVNQLIASSAENKIDGILLDLRNNGGGSLLEAIMLTGLFINQGPVVQVRERFWTKTLYDRDAGISYSGPLVVLVNMNSASASEILAGALQDYGRAVIVGDSKTHGKGTVQTIMPLDQNNEALGCVRITSASYYRISGGSTQLRGITPDIIIPSAWEYLALDEKTLSNPMPWSMLPAVKYTTNDLLKQHIPVLERLSMERLAEDELFKTYTNQLERIRQRIETSEISLNIDERRKQIKTDEELLELQEQLSAAEIAGEDEDISKQSDVVLMESLKILADLADKYAEDALNDQEKPAPKTRNKSLLDTLVEWMLNV